MTQPYRRKVMSRFFLRIGRKARERWRDECTGQLFGIAEYLRCEGLLAKDAAPMQGLPAVSSASLPTSRMPLPAANKRLARAAVVDVSDSAQQPASAAAYLSQCERAIAQAAREYRGHASFGEGG